MNPKEKKYFGKWRNVIRGG